ncbi:MAG TPA: ABATE domain-containing protein [Candidatus Acidoferrum sp.]|nr:ABATE domain-containing protein [Candidatus Acidoferrum sp.]
MGSSHDETAPGELELVRTFINTADLLRGAETLASPAQLAAWLSERGLIDRDATLGEEDVVRARDVREALRCLIAANGGPACAPEALATLQEAAARAPLQVRFDERGLGARLEPLDQGVDGALARLLAIVHRAMHVGEWSRIKTCRDPECRWAFFDHSKNRSAAWCDMASCGNRNKARRRRQGHAHTTA